MGGLALTDLAAGRGCRVAAAHLLRARPDLSALAAQPASASRRTERSMALLARLYWTLLEPLHRPHGTRVARRGDRLRGGLLADGLREARQRSMSTRLLPTTQIRRLADQLHRQLLSLPTGLEVRRVLACCGQPHAGDMASCQESDVLGAVSRHMLRARMRDPCGVTPPTGLPTDPLCLHHYPLMLTPFSNLRGNFAYFRFDCILFLQVFCYPSPAIGKNLRARVRNLLF
mmetsp:Transcript_50982/g.108940  ORF Transcript_50982/g.108940 Transcript_50982/m.108940 type:complete len:230 (-) Transcript_50982:37-726(-)